MKSRIAFVMIVVIYISLVQRKLSSAARSTCIFGIRSAARRAVLLCFSTAARFCSFFLTLSANLLDFNAAAISFHGTIVCQLFDEVCHQEFLLVFIFDPRRYGGVNEFSDNVIDNSESFFNGLEMEIIWVIIQGVNTRRIR